ncbi:MAG: biotin--[acetyl-CoA-carboxylase] ligase [Gemmatimonadaceae bacterium]|nr:biotin--[acetyl-CoA-carboxylase] ligase [Gemmatimonadaceae bacterium]
MTWLGHDGAALAARLGLPRVVALPAVGSTMDAAHELAALGAPAGTLVIAERQEAGRGRNGRAWQSAPGAGLWLTLIERPATPAALEVLSLRVGLALAPALERWTTAPIRLKWPNDLFVGERKLAGVLLEARWRGERPDWVALGVGVNLVVPHGVPESAALVDAEAEQALAAVIPAVRAAAARTGPLTADELSAFAARDFASGRRVSAPALGTVRGITASGALLVETLDGIVPVHSGSLVLATTP